MDKALRETIEQVRRDLSAMSAEECLSVAQFVRDAKPRLATDRQRELAEECAKDFEMRAAERASSQGTV